MFEFAVGQWFYDNNLQKKFRITRIDHTVELTYDDNHTAYWFEETMQLQLKDHEFLFIPTKIEDMVIGATYEHCALGIPWRVTNVESPEKIHYILEGGAQATTTSRDSLSGKVWRRIMKNEGAIWKNLYTQP
jgi:hypothetical protein